MLKVILAAMVSFGLSFAAFAQGDAPTADKTGTPNAEAPAPTKAMKAAKKAHKKHHAKKETKAE